MDNNREAVGNTIERIVDQCVRCKTCTTFCPPLVATGISMETFVQFHLMSPNSQKDFGAYLDLCIACRRCLLECPSGIDMGALVLEGRRRQVVRSGQPLSDRVLERLDVVSRLASQTAPASNALLQWRPARVMAQEILGLQGNRVLPRFQRLHLRTKATSGDRKQTRKVAFFTGCYINYADGDGVGQSVVDLLEQHGCQVIVPDQVCTGVARIAYGDHEGAIQNLSYNVTSLRSWVEQGYDIVTACSSCHFALRHEYPRLVPDEETRRVADSTWDLFEYLSLVLQIHKVEQESTENRLRVVCHSSCHARAGQVDGYVAEILSALPGVDMRIVDDSCCGMGGTFGLKEANYDLSMAIGQQTASKIAATEPDFVVSTCPACRMQLSELLDGVPCIHPALLLRNGSELDALRERSAAS